MRKYILIPLIMCFVMFSCRQPWTAADTHKVTKPIYGVVFFTRQDCRYCQEMKKNIWTAPAVKRRVAKLRWYEVDVAKYPEIAKKYKVKTLPTTFFIKISDDRKTGTALRRKNGYMGVAETLIFLREQIIK